MLVYITGPSGAGKTTVMKTLPVRSYDLDDLYEAEWKTKKTVAQVNKGVKARIEELQKRAKNLCFVGLQGKEDLPFTPDLMIILERTDYEVFFRQKLVRDLDLLCKYKKDFKDVLENKPFEEFRNYFWSNDVVGMKTLEEFTALLKKRYAALRKDFPGAHGLTAAEIPGFLVKKLELK
jgi:hypothetical protein